MFMDSLGHKIQYCSLSILPMLNYRFNTVSSRFFFFLRNLQADFKNLNGNI